MTIRSVSKVSHVDSQCVLHSLILSSTYHAETVAQTLVSSPPIISEAAVGSEAVAQTLVYSPPIMPEAAVGSDLLQSFQVLPQLVLQLVGQDLRVLAVLDILLSVQEPVRDLVLTRVLHDRNHTVNLYMCVCICRCVCVYMGET